MKLYHLHPILKLSSNNGSVITCNFINRETDLAPPTPEKVFFKRCFNYDGALQRNNLLLRAKYAESVIPLNRF